ncbi:MAG TPA: guanylate kinase [Terriglobia bacterium]|nr:guanylate kinase [Terriglobia bacterium]
MISAPSGAGKTTLVNGLLRSLPGLRFSVSHTTRRPRPGEQEGREYFFVARRRFDRMVRRGEFVEWAEVYGHLYGTSWKALRQAQAAGFDVLLDIDVQGHRQVRRRLAEAVSVFVLPPSLQELERRLRRRHLDQPAEIERRLADARHEVRHWPEYDFLVVNDALTPAVRALRSIVMAARCRRLVQQDRVREIVEGFGG